MRRRVLIVVSSYAPTMIADMHRARHLAWELPNYGWEVEILSPDSSYQHVSCLDSDSKEFFSPSIPVHFISKSRFPLLRYAGFGSIGWHALLPMAHAGLSLLKKRHFDIVYISTTQFPLFLLGLLWNWWLKVPFALDLHDPCYKEGDAQPVWAKPGLKHFINRWVTKHIESLTLRTAAGLVSVSPAYIRILRRRYEKMRPHCLEKEWNAVIPFSAFSRDLEEAAKHISKASRTANASSTIVYIGAGGPIMQRSFLLLCRVLAYLRVQEPRLINSIRIECYGTMLGWREGDRRHFVDMAQSASIEELIHEHPQRVSYRQSLELLFDSDGVLILGVDDEGYMPSKLFSYALSGKPLLAVLQKNGPAFEQLHQTPNMGHALWFDETGEIPLPEAAKFVYAFLQEVVARHTFDRRPILEPFMAAAMARRHADLFNRCIGNHTI